jgi:large subunit ribosomal protein L7/L12
MLAVVVLVLLVLAVGVVGWTRRAGASAEVRQPPREYAVPGHCTVVLGDPGAKPIETIKAIREVTDVGLAQAKDWIGATPCAIAGALSPESADRMRARLEQAGATAWVEAP